MLVFYDSNTGEEVSTWNGFLRRKVFFIHGTISAPKRWKNWSEAVEVLNKISQPLPEDAYDVDFSWEDEATQYNSLKDRWPVSDRLVKYVKDKVQSGDSKYEEVVLVGHSHGGNVAIMAADKLAKDPDIARVYVITLGTPVFNKVTFKTSSKIDEFKQAADMKMTYVYRGMYNQPAAIPIYTYYNPENPANWENGHKITHLSIYNKYDRVDGFAQTGSPFLEDSRMTWNSSTFTYDESINKGLKSRLTINEKNRLEYCNYCMLIIEMLTKLKIIINSVEISTEINDNKTSRAPGQDNAYIEKNYQKIEFLGYRKLSAVLPKFNEINLNLYLSGRLPRLKNLNIHSMRLEEFWVLFSSGIQYSDFCILFEEESKGPLLKNNPYPMSEVDFRSPNIKLIDEQIEKLSEEITRVKAFNVRTYDEKYGKPKWWLDVLAIIYPSWSNVKYLREYICEGVNNHGFDTNSPELIQAEIDEGRIKPFPMVEITAKNR